MGTEGACPFPLYPYGCPLPPSEIAAGLKQAWAISHLPCPPNAQAWLPSCWPRPSPQELPVSYQNTTRAASREQCQGSRQPCTGCQPQVPMLKGGTALPGLGYKCPGHLLWPGAPSTPGSWEMGCGWQAASPTGLPHPPSGAGLWSSLGTQLACRGLGKGWWGGYRVAVLTLGSPGSRGHQPRGAAGSVQDRALLSPPALRAPRGGRRAEPRPSRGRSPGRGEGSKLKPKSTRH